MVSTEPETEELLRNILFYSVMGSCYINKHVTPETHYAYDSKIVEISQIIRRLDLTGSIK